MPTDNWFVRHTRARSLTATVALVALAALPGAVLVSSSTAASAATPSTTAGSGTTSEDPSSPPPAAASPAPSGSAPAVDGVHVGAGSYAPTPPDSISDIGDVQAFLGQKVHVDPSVAGKPVPSNQWWTSIVHNGNGFSGDLWSNPFVSSNSAAGTKVTYPDSWNADGSQMVQNHAITVSGAVTPPPSTDRVLADFEHGIPSGWTATGTAFTTLGGTGAGQSKVVGWKDSGYLTSWGAKNGDAATGTLTTTPFTIDRSGIAFLLGGGSYPDPGVDEAELLVGGKVVATATGKQSEQLAWTSWDVSAYRGQQAQIRFVDQTKGGYGHLMVDQVTLTDSRADIADHGSTAFSATENDALRWGDWNVSWRMPQKGDGGQYMDVTSVQGEPYQWFEYHDETPRITTESGATFTDGDGQPIAFPFTGNSFEVRQSGHVFGVHAADGTTFTLTGNTIDATTGTWLAVSAVPKSGLTLAQLQQHAGAIPRDTRMDYSYDSAKGLVHERWKVTTDLLQGSDHSVVQGWLQHQYEDGTTNFSLTGAEYATPRGTMKTAVGGDDWTIDYPFEGMTPIAGTPKGAASDPVLQKYLSDYSTMPTCTGDTYWQGKCLEQLAEYMTVAKQIGDTDYAAKMQATLETSLTDWYTYTTGEKQDFFARYPTWGALVGFADSYGSGQLNDQHFHYGYFAVATALLGAVDPAWVKRYEGMATLVTKEYANWDRDDDAFPHLRTFGVWAGHSNAAGVSSPQGQNQESSSEAIQSEAGLFLLGTVLGNEDMQATGAMEYVNERLAVRDYYQNVHGNPDSATYDGNGAFPSQYQHPQAGMLQDWGQAWSTYFDGDAAWKGGIQWMPTAPWFDYFGWDKQFSGSILKTILEERPKEQGEADVKSANQDHIQMLTKKWYGIGTYGSVSITKDQNAAIGELEDAIRSAEKNHPGYVTAKTADNPLYDPSTDTLLVSVDSTGKVTFPKEHWTPTTLPASLVPTEISAAEADKKPSQWTHASPLMPYLSTNYTADTDTVDRLYSFDPTHYTPGVDTARAAGVISDMGDALGEVVMGFLLQYDPATYADIHAALWKAKDGAVTGKSMAGMNYWQGMSNLTLGTESTTRHTSDPLSQAFRDADGNWSYVLDNVGDTQQSYDVYDGSKVIGSVAVPAHTQITSHLDAHLAKVVVGTDGSPKTLTPGSATTFTATGYDQYGATIPLDHVQWTSSTGTVSSSGVLTTGAAVDHATVTATVGSMSDRYAFRVAPAPVLTSIDVTPGFHRVVVGSAQRFAAAGADQYGDPFALPSGTTWSYTGPGSIAADGTLTTSGPGAGYVVATAGSVEGSAVASSVASIPVASAGATATATSNTVGNKPANVLDGNPSTRWESTQGTDDADLTIDLGKETDVSHVHIDWETAAAKQYSLQVADAASGPWTTITTVSKKDAKADDLDVAGTGRYVRMHGITRLTSYGYSILDLAISGTPAEAAITPTQLLVSPRSSAVLPGATAELGADAFDGNGFGGPVGSDASWSVAGGGSVDDSGTVTAPADAGATATVTATVGPLHGTATVTAVRNAATAPTAPSGTSRDVAVGKAVSTSSAERGDLSGTQAVDDDPSTRWASAARDGEWIAVDLGEVLPIDRVELDWEGAYAKTYQLQVRDGASDDWRTVADVTGGTGGVDTHDLQGVQGRYLRMLGGKRATAYGYSLYAVEVFSTKGAPSPDLARNAVVTASSSESSSVGPRNAVDGDATSRWASGHSDDQWLQLDLGTARTLRSAHIDWEGAYGSAYRIEGRNSSTDDWTTIASVTDGDGGADDVALSGDWRYVRLHGVHRATPYGYSVYSLQLR